MGKTAIIVGAGIVGLATARALAVRGYRVTVIERSAMAVGASIRNFGMIWPVGQPDGELYETAMLSKSIWKKLCTEAAIWYDEVGSLHVVYEKDEWEVINEFAAATAGQREYSVLSATETANQSAAVVTEGLMGALWSPDEMIVDPRKAIAVIPGWLHAKYQVEFAWGKAVTAITHPSVFAGAETWEADEIYVCSGADFETLYPTLFSAAPLTKCKLQMMRMAAQPGNSRIGPALCGGLSLIHYKSFGAAPSLPGLRNRFEQQYAEYMNWGIHVMVAQNEGGELTIGDSHEYALTHDPFNKQFINQLITDYLKKFACFKNETVTETWNGIYPKLTNGDAFLVMQPEAGVTIINGLGGAGMTLSFGVCEKLIATV
jgi:FAD dependent oxidoreductase TIGR03364